MHMFVIPRDVKFTGLKRNAVCLPLKSLPSFSATLYRCMRNIKILIARKETLSSRPFFPLSCIVLKLAALPREESPLQAARCQLCGYFLEAFKCVSMSTIYNRGKSRCIFFNELSAGCAFKVTPG